MMRRLFLVLALAACDPGPPKIDDVRFDVSSYYRTDLLTYDIDTQHYSYELPGKGLSGVTIAEGFAIVIRIQANWTKYSSPDELKGPLHAKVGDPALVDFVPVPGEDRRFFLIAKARGTTKIDVTVDGAMGQQSIPLTIKAQP